jgi:hypothetical protein
VVSAGGCCRNPSTRALGSARYRGSGWLTRGRRRAGCYALDGGGPDGVDDGGAKITSRTITPDSRGDMVAETVQVVGTPEFSALVECLKAVGRLA